MNLHVHVLSGGTTEYSTSRVGEERSPLISNIRTLDSVA